MPIYEITQFRGGISDYEDKGIEGAFKFGSNLNIRKTKDSLSLNQDLVDEDIREGEDLPSISPSVSPSPSLSPSASASSSPSKSQSPSRSASASPSKSQSPSASASSSASASQSPSASESISPSASLSPSASQSPSASESPSLSPSASGSASGSASTSPSASVSPSASISPSVSLGALTTFSDLILWFVKSKSDGYVYGFGDAGYIYKRHLSAESWQVVYQDTGKITGAAEWYANTGKKYLYWATDTTLHRKELPGLDNWDDVDADSGWPKTNLTSADWHTMREAGGALIIANSNFLALVGYDESYTNEALDLIPGNIAKTIVERKGRSIIGTVRASDPDTGINGAVDSEVPLAQRGTDGEIFFSDMINTVPVRRFPGGGQVNPGGVTNEIDDIGFFEWEQDALSWIDKQSVSNMALFGVWNADTDRNGIYSYGRRNKNHPFVMNLEYKMDVDEIGAITNANGTILASYETDGEYGVLAYDPNNKAQGTYESLDLKAPAKMPINITNWKYAEIFCEPLPSGASIQMYYKLDKTGDWNQALVDGETSYTTVGGSKAIFSIGANADVIELRLILTPIGNQDIEVHKIEMFFN